MKLFQIPKFRNKKLFEIINLISLLALSIPWNILKGQIQWRSIEEEACSSCSLALLLASPPAIYTARSLEMEGRAGEQEDQGSRAITLPIVKSWAGFVSVRGSPTCADYLDSSSNGGYLVFGTSSTRTSRAWTMDTRPCSINIGISNTRPEWLSTRVKGSRFYVLLFLLLTLCFVSDARLIDSSG